MNGIDHLKSRAADLDLEDLFLLLTAACSQCCEEHTGGNKDCPPPPKLEMAQ